MKKPASESQSIPTEKVINGGRQWTFNGQLHRVDGPAVEWGSGKKEWYLNGKRHRVDGPAIERADGTHEWWLNGNCTESMGPLLRGLVAQNSGGFMGKS